MAKHWTEYKTFIERRQRLFEQYPDIYKRIAEMKRQRARGHALRGYDLNAPKRSLWERIWRWHGWRWN